MLTEDLREKIKELAYECPDVKELQFIRDAKDDVDISEIGNGLVNNLVVVRPAGQPSPAVVFKHGPPYAKFMGPETPLSQSRVATEFESYVYFNKLCPGSTPRPYCYSPKNSIFAMEYLDGYENLLDNLMTRPINWRLIEKLVNNIATIHSSTHRANIGETEFDELQRKFPNTDMVSKIGEYIFKMLVRDNPTYPTAGHLKVIADDLYNDETFASNVRKLKSLYLNKKECLAHYDLHANSVMVRGDSVKIIDNELTTVGAAAWDIAYVVNHFIYNYVREMTTISKDRDHSTTAADDMLKALKYAIELYIDRMSTSICKEEANTFIPEALISDIAGAMGYSMCSRLLGHFATKDAAVSDAVKVRALQIGVRLIREHSVIRTVGEIVVFVRTTL